MRWCCLVVLAALAACGDNRSGPRDAAPAPYPDAPPFDDAGPRIDYEEGPEPNGLGVVEASGAPAGAIPKLKPIGEALILHGHLAPFRDANSDGELDTDVDTFTLAIAAPALVRISIDNALDAVGVRIHADPPGAGPFDRYAFAQPREVYLPVAGTYRLSVTDAELWIFQLGLGPVDVPVTGEYRVAIEQLVVPAPIATNSDDGMLAPGDIRFYAPAFGAGLSLVAWKLAGPLARPALMIVEQDPPPSGARIIAQGDRADSVELVAAIPQGTTQLVVADALYNLADAPLLYSFAVSSNLAGELPSNVPLTIAQGRTTPPTNLQETFELAQLKFPGGLVTAFDLVFDHPVRAAILGEGGSRIDLAGLDTDAPTWTEYHGLVHLPRNGTYGLFVYDPSGAPSFTVTAALRRYAGSIGSEGTFDMAMVHGATGFMYDAGTTHPLQTLDTFGAATGGATLSFYDGAALGRLDPLATSAGTLPGLAPVWSFSVGDGAERRLRSYAGEAITTFAVAVRTVSSVASEVGVDVYASDEVDVGTLVTPLSRSASLFPGNLPVFAGVHAAPGTPITIAVTPSTLRVRVLDRFGTAIATGPTTIVQDATGWTAVSIDAVSDPATAIPFTVTFTP